MSKLSSIEFADNPDPRCACVLLLDTSGSMDKQPIAALNEGLRAFQEDIRQDELAQRRTEIAVVTFGCGGVQVFSPITGDMQPIDVPLADDKVFIVARDFEAPRLAADGLTPMGQAVHYGLDLVRKRKDEYKASGIPYFRPWVFLVTDGEPTDSYESAVRRVHAEVASNQLLFFAVGVPPLANMERLTEIAPSGTPPVQLDGLKFSEMFLWVSRSQQIVSRSQVGMQIPLPSIGNWANAIV